MDLHALADFNLVASYGGLGRASRASGKSKATLSRRIIALEASLGVRLIERGTQSLRLTEEGAALHARTDGLLGEIAEAGQAISASVAQPRGKLKVSASMVFAHTGLGRIAAKFTNTYPDIRLEITAEDRAVDLIEEGYDIVIRVNPKPDDRLVGRCFLSSETLLVGAPSLDAKDFEEIDGSTLLPAVTRREIRENKVWHVRERGIVRDYRPDPVLRLSSVLMIRDAVAEGAGFALLPRFMIETDLSAGRLVCCGVSEERQRAVWALHSSRRLVNSRVRAFLDCLDGAFPADRGTS